MSTSTHLQTIRQAMPALTARIHLNTGTFGPLPAPAFQAIQQRLQTEWQQGRLGPDAFESISTIYSSARESVARLLHASVDEIALTDNTGEGMNIISYGFNWRAGDEIITTSHEHISALAPLYQIRDRFGAVIHTIELGPRAERSPVELIEPLINSRTRLIVLSHVSYMTGTVLDVHAVNQLAHAHGIPVLIDGAQSAGNIPIDVKALEADFYAIPMQKWLCGPDGTGALYVRRESQHYILPTYVGYFSLEDMHDWTLHPAARRFELGGRQTAAIAGQQASLHWLESVVGYSWLFERIATLNSYAAQALQDIPGLTICTPQPGASGLLSFTLAEHDDTQIVQSLQANQRIAIRNIPPTGMVRISTGFYNTEEEIDLLIQALRAL